MSDKHMKKTILTFFLAGITLYGCGTAGATREAVSEEVQNAESGQGVEDATGLQEPEGGQPAEDTQEGNPEAEASEDQATVQGPYGSIGITIPDGWSYEICGVDNENLLSAKYGIQFSPENADSGYIEVGYQPWFGVCGTGLEEEETTLAGDQAQIGYYDGSRVWDFVCFGGVNEGIVATATQNEDWSGQELDQALAILDTVVFRAEEQTGAIGVYDEDSFMEEFCLSVSAKKITGTGATLVFCQSDSSLESELSFDEQLTVEKKTEEGWTEADVVVDGEYVYNDVAHIISIDGTTEYQYDWSWLYGELDAGEYRIAVPVMNWRGTGDYDSEVVYAHFLMR
jgi:hypothetical protein